jgi:diguanylate cyclase (GGDEF)-like protein
MNQKVPAKGEDIGAVGSAKTSRTSSLVFQAATFIIVVATALIISNVWNLWHSYHVALTKAHNSSANLTHAMSQHANDTFKQAEMVLDDIQRNIETSGTQKLDSEKMHHLFASRVEKMPLIHAIYFFDAQGMMRATSNDSFPADKDDASDDYFRFHKSNTDPHPRIGSVVKSRISDDLIVPISIRINNPDGSFSGVVLETLYLEHFRSFYAKFVLGDDSTLLIMLNDGKVIYHQAIDSNATGTNMADSPLYKDNINVNHSGSVASSLSPEQSEKIFSYTHLANFPIVVAAGIGTNQALAEWRREAVTNSLTVLIVLVIVAGLGISLLRQIRARVAIENELLRTQQTLERLNKALAEQALEDSLTGLANRRSFDLSLEIQFARAIQQSRSLGLILFDIDYFKQYNDIYGHVAGDNVLRHIGQALKGITLRPYDLIARYGGEEFIILLPDTDKEGAQAIAERAYREILLLNLPHQASPTGYLTISAGVHVCQPIAGKDSPSQMIATADSALYQAKREGRNRIQLAD